VTKCDAVTFLSLLGQNLINFFGPSSVGLVLKMFLVNATEDPILIGRHVPYGGPCGPPYPRTMVIPELATALHPGVKMDPGADGRHGDQLITCIVACVVSCTVLALLYREWRVYDYSCSSGTTTLLIVRWSILARDSVRHAAGRRHPCKPL